MEPGSAQAEHRNLETQNTTMMLNILDTGQKSPGTVLGGNLGGEILTCRENEGQEVEGSPVHGGDGFVELFSKAAFLGLNSPSSSYPLLLQHKEGGASNANIFSILQHD